MLLLQEILGGIAYGLVWEAIVESLNKIDSPRVVRERWVLLRKKFKTKMSEEEKERGISLDDLKGKEQLIVELFSRDHTATSEADFASKQQDND